MACRFSGLLPASPFSGHITVDHQAARNLANDVCLADPLHFIEQLEAIAKGLNSK